MFEVFGNFDTAEELNACAKGLLEEGDLEHLKVLAKENGIPEAMLDGYTQGIQGELTDQINAAIGKLEVEKETMKKGGLPMQGKADSPAGQESASDTFQPFRRRVFQTIPAPRPQKSLPVPSPVVPHSPSRAAFPPRGQFRHG